MANGTKEETVLGNVNRLEKERLRVLAKEGANLGDMVIVLCEQTSDGKFHPDGEFRRLYAEFRDSLSGEKRSAGDVACEERVSGVCRTAFLCRRIADRLGYCGIGGIGAFTDASAVGNGIISYFRSAPADEAYRIFSEQIENPRVLYASSFEQSCENVYTENSGYCIIPIENGSDGRLAGFRQMMEKHGLKIVMTCRVQTAKYGDYTTFALASKHTVIPKNGKDAYLDVRIATEDLTGLICGAEASGLTVCHAEYSGLKKEADVTVGNIGDGACGFLTFLSLEYGNYTLNGVYRDIRKGKI